MKIHWSRGILCSLNTLLRAPMTEPKLNFKTGNGRRPYQGKAFFGEKGKFEDLRTVRLRLTVFKFISKPSADESV